MMTINGQQITVGGDVIIAYNGQTVKSSDDLIAFLAIQGSGTDCDSNCVTQWYTNSGTGYSGGPSQFVNVNISAFCSVAPDHVNG